MWFAAYCDPHNMFDLNDLLSAPNLAAISPEHLHQACTPEFVRRSTVE